MSVTVLLAVLAAAFLHALWNALIRLGGSKIRAMVMLSLAEAGVGVAVVVTRPMPIPEAWPWIIGAGFVHFAYKFFLAHAYEQGDLSRVYPIARGAAPMMVAIVSALFALDHIEPSGYAGIAVLGLGILLMARGVFTDGESRRLLPFALGSAVATATYTIVDGMGARVAGDAPGYVGWLMIGGGLGFALLMIAQRGTRYLISPPRDWGLAVLGAGASYGAYAISIWAMTVAPIALVAVLRETSILFAVLIGWLVFRERMTRHKALAAGLIVCGVVLTRL
ncbi:DMT family transporter [Pseudothioclava nitratireducens]|uniref:DMT family transporter n=1 Tax=Pseudothioclava nitratireducens TaxID=1928646 RepID=UPI0023DBB8EA|nr:DMT family transporter [Defluviimonas nitratireducens]MDF1619713.1 DMT family transporter [Defluviimonas nitratireducens]